MLPAPPPGRQTVDISGMINTLADSLSRLDQAGDYELKQEHCLCGIRALGVELSIDCFANQLKAYYETQKPSELLRVLGKEILKAKGLTKAQPPKN
jgi:hypothetical protein